MQPIQHPRAKPMSPQYYQRYSNHGDIKKCTNKKQKNHHQNQQEKMGPIGLLTILDCELSSLLIIFTLAQPNLIGK